MIRAGSLRCDSTGLAVYFAEVVTMAPPLYHLLPSGKLQQQVREKGLPNAQRREAGFMA